LLRLVAEFETPQYYALTDYARLEERVRTGIVGLHHLSDILRNDDGTTEGPGHVFDIPKCHLLGGAAKFIRRFGSLLNIDTEGGERSMKDVIRADAHVDRGSTSALLQRVVSLEGDRRLAAGRASTAPAPAMLPRPTQERRSSARNYAAMELEHTALGKDLICGRYGPAVTLDIIQECAIEAARILELAVGREWCYAEHASAYGADVAVAFLILRAGHCVRLRDGRYAQVLLPHFECAPSSAPYASGGRSSRRAADVTALMSTFELARPGSVDGNHPEFPVPWVKRGRLRAVPVSEVAAREHIVPLFGRFGIAASDRAPYFLVNLTASPCYNGDRAPAGTARPHEPPVVHLKCRTAGCDGYLPKPPEAAGISTCALCEQQRIWF